MVDDKSIFKLADHQTMAWEIIPKHHVEPGERQLKTATEYGSEEQATAEGITKLGMLSIAIGKRFARLRENTKGLSTELSNQMLWKETAGGLSEDLDHLYPQREEFSRAGPVGISQAVRRLVGPHSPWPRHAAQPVLQGAVPTHVLPTPPTDLPNGLKVSVISDSLFSMGLPKELCEHKGKFDHKGSWRARADVFDHPCFDKKQYFPAGAIGYNAQWDFHPCDGGGAIHLLRELIHLKQKVDRGEQSRPDVVVIAWTYNEYFAL